MKFSLSLIVIASTVFLASCSSTKYKTFTTESDFKTASEMIKGKTPKEAAQLIGKPMSAYFHNGGDDYLMVYPMSDKEVSMTDLMFNDRLECVSFSFEKDKKFVYEGWNSNTSFTCGAIKGQKLDTSLID